MVEPMHDSTIELSQLLSKRRRVRDALVTTILWALYGYLWLPLISFVAWYLGFDFAYRLVIKAGGPDALVALLIGFSIIILVVLLIVVTWSGLQYSRFAGKGERRLISSTLAPQAEREYWDIDAALQSKFKAKKIQTVALTDDAKIAAVT
jgi:biofilm PGA synthesis protein PgaD